MYRAALDNYRSELQKQITQKKNDETNSKIMNKIKGD